MKYYNTVGEIHCKLRYVRSEFQRMFPKGRLDDDDLLKKFKSQFGMPDGIDSRQAYYWIDCILEANITKAGLLAEIEERSEEGLTAWNEFLMSTMEDAENSITSLLKSV